ncbi:MAG: baseplate multidomain protein megatron [Rhizobiaceae bacterium]
MATILLQAAGAFLGGFLGPVGATLGKAAGALAGYMVDRALISSTQHFEGPRLAGQRLFSAEEGASIPRVYGTARVTGNLIWATRFEEQARTTRRGFKGGPRTTTYHYFANAAFALCEGRIAGVRRIWVDGRELDPETVSIRMHNGGEEQPVDPLIAAKQGEGNAPAYRGVAYAVIERFPLDEYGNRIPQFHFEVMRPVGGLNDRVRSVALIPGATEYGLATELVTLSPAPGEAIALNRHALSGPCDVVAALDELQALCPNLEEVALVVTWFGVDLRAGHCRIRPKVTRKDIGQVGRPWRVSGLDRAEAVAVSQVDGTAAYGGTPADFSVLQAIAEIKSRGLRVMLHPFIMMDVPGENGLPDPHGGAEQAPYPWRGRITCHPGPDQPDSADRSAAARNQVAAFAGSASVADFAAGADTIHHLGDPQDWGFRRFILHHAHLAAAAGGVDAFLIGSEMRGLSRLRDGADAFPFVEELCALAGSVRAIAGPGTQISYGADWSEYFGHQPADGSGDVFFHLDDFWAHEEVAAVAIHNYMPLSDWRDEDHGGGNPDGFLEPYDRDGLKNQITSGEGFDWFYASALDRLERQRSPIVDGAYGKHWVFRYKDLVAWWENAHFNRPGGVEVASPTAWVPRSKPIWFTELGCPAVDKGPNQPNVFPDPKSSENAAPHFSDKGRSDLAQRRFIEAHQEHWDPGHPAFVETGNPVSETYSGRMVDAARITLWAWDARPFPAFPARGDVWADGDNWQLGHWLNGRLSGIAVSDLIDAILADHELPGADTRGVAGTLTGYVSEDPTTARAALEPVAELFGLAAHEQGGDLIFFSETRGVQRKELSDLVIPDASPMRERTRLPDHELPGEVELGYRDLFLDHQGAVARAEKWSGAGAGRAALALPAVMDGGQARALLEDWLSRKWAGRESTKLALSPAARDIAPGALIAVADEAREYIVTRIDDGLSRQVSARRVRRNAPAPWRPATPPPGSNAAMLAAAPHAVFLDLPMGPQETSPENQFRVALRAKPWRSQIVLASPETTGFASRATVTAPATLGRLAASLVGGPEGRLDRFGSVLVELFDGEFASVSRLQMLNGANAAAIRSTSGAWEVVQFQTAQEIAPSLWRLTNLLRGQLGTGDAMAAGAEPGADLVLLGEAVGPAGLQSSEIGLELNWRVVPSGSDLDGTAAAQSVETGGVRAIIPLAPVHPRLRREGDAAVFSWIRRGRFDADSWTGTDIPLGEAREAYLVSLGLPGSAPVRDWQVSEPRLTYPVAAIEADFGAVPAALELRVRQISESIGPGLPATALFPLSHLF